MERGTTDTRSQLPRLRGCEKIAGRREGVPGRVRQDAGSPKSGSLAGLRDPIFGFPQRRRARPGASAVGWRFFHSLSPLRARGGIHAHRTSAHRGREARESLERPAGPPCARLANFSELPYIYRHVAAMPDVHGGIGATIGSVIATKKGIVPAAVGMDIGCAMATVRLSLSAEDIGERSLKKVFDRCLDRPDLVRGAVGAQKPRSGPCQGQQARLSGRLDAH
jgi:hypothetical protein